MNSPKNREIKTLINLGLREHQANNIAEAKKNYLAVLALDPNHFDALHLLGLVAALNKDYEKAIELIQRAVLIRPLSATANLNLGIAFYESKRFELAIKCFDRAIDNDSHCIEAFFYRGLVNQEIQRIEYAKADYEIVISLKPHHVGALFNLGKLLQDQLDYEEALILYEKVIAVDPKMFMAYNNRGYIYHRVRKFKEACSDYLKALSINPKYPEAHNNFGITLHAMKIFDGSLDQYNKALNLNSQFLEAYHNRANLFYEIKKYQLASIDFEKVLSIHPDYEYVLGQNLMSRMNLCNWNDYQTSIDTLRLRIKEGKSVCSPFILLGLIDSLDLQLEAAKIWANNYLSYANLDTFECSIGRNEKIRVGYFSADYYEHPMMLLMAELFEVHNKNKFEIIGFSLSPPRHDAMRARVSKAFSEFYDVHQMPDHEIALFARDKKIDIAVDLNGYTLDAKPGIFFQRAAPVQVSYLGYPGTMSAECMDYIIADEIVIPQESQRFYTEKVLYLPGCYQVNGSGREISNAFPTREGCGLPKTGFIYCCFNNSYKVTPVLFDVWMKILLEVKQSYLWLLGGDDVTNLNLCKEAQKRGVSGDRIIFAGPVPLNNHLARHLLADLFLDTLPYNAHTTASDALSMGLPVLTCPGESFSSRVAASLLKNIGLSELVVENLKDYESLAISLGRQPDFLKAIKAKLKNNQTSSNIFNSAEFAANLERLYETIVNR